MNYCEAMVIDEGGLDEAMGDFDLNHTCGEPTTIKHHGYYYCEFHYELFFEKTEEEKL